MPFIYRDHIYQREQRPRELPQRYHNKHTPSKLQQHLMHLPRPSIIIYILVAKDHRILEGIDMDMESHVLQLVINILMLFCQAPNHLCLRKRLWSNPLQGRYNFKLYNNYLVACIDHIIANGGISYHYAV